MPPDTPIQVRRAVALMWISLVIGIVMAFPAWEPLDPEMKEYELVMWIVMALSCLVPAILIVFVSRRKNWARIATLILTIVGIGSYIAFAPDVTTEPAWYAASTVLTMAMDLVALYWLYFGHGAQWFRSAKAGTRAV